MTPLKNIKKIAIFQLSPKKFLWTKIFCPLSRLSDFVWTKIFPNLLFLNQSLSWWLFIEIVLNADWLLSLVRELGFAKQYQVSTFYQNTFSKLVMSSLLPWSGQQDLSGILSFQLEKWLYGRMKCKWYFHNWDLCV